MITVHDVIEQLGGRTAAATLVGRGEEAVKKWEQKGFVPSLHWSAVVAETDGKITYDALASLAARVQKMRAA